MIELGNDQDIVALTVHDPERKLLVAASDGRGFIVPEKEVVAQTRGGRQVLNVRGSVEACVCTPVAGDSVAVIGSNRKLLIFPAEELPEMTRGRGVIMQRYNKGTLSDAITFNLADGLPWRIGERVRTETKLDDWIGRRAQAGRVAPRGFSKGNTFGL